MKRVVGCAALGLGALGVVACLTGVVAIWVVRPHVLGTSVEVLDTADDALQLVEEKTTRAGQLLKAIRGVVDPATAKILRLADKAQRTPDDEKQIHEMEETLTQRLGQVDAIAEQADTAITFLNKTSRLGKSLRLPAGRGAAVPENTRDSSDALARVAKALKELREYLAKFRADKQLQQHVIDAVVRLAREVDDDLKLVESRLAEVRQRGVEFQAEVAELRSEVPWWTDWVAGIGTLVLAWMGVGQLALSRAGWLRVRGR